MSFRRTLFWGIAATILVMVSFEALFDVVIDGVTARERAAVDERVEHALDEVAQAWSNDAVPALLASPSAGGLRHGTAVLIEGDGAYGDPAAFPEPESAYAHGLLVVGTDTRIQVALPLRRSEQVLTNKLLLDLLDLPVFVVLAFAAAGLLTRIVMKPVRDLTAATTELADQRFPDPVPVPPGNDELALLADSFNRMSDAIRRHLERERTFTRYASHELRTPIAAMRVQLERRRYGDADTEAVAQSLERQLGRIEDVIDALLALTRGNVRATEPTSLAALIDDVLSTLPPKERSRVEIRHPPADGVAVTDARLVHQALQNLVSNALVHGSGSAAISVVKHDDSVTVRVTDAGKGVPEQTLERVREPYFRANDAAAGTGLGLSLVDCIVEALGGRLDLHNTRSGLEAAITLPVSATAPPLA